MVNEKNKTLNDKNLAEKCRIALEKSYGSQIPMPKSIANKH
jgi:hypothetical protein